MTNELTPSNDTTFLDRQGIKIDAQIESQVVTAKAFPRDLQKCLKNILDIVCLDETTAESCFYTMPPRKDEKNSITGPSIRLAEICFSMFGNIQTGTRIISNDGKAIVVEGWCRDLEMNNTVSSQVSRSILTKENKQYSPSMQGTTAAAASSIALRNAIFKIIPGVFIDKAYKQAMKIAVGGKDKAKILEKVRRTLESFEKYQINDTRVLYYFGHKSIEDISYADLTEMIGIGTALKDGLIQPNEAFVQKKEGRNISEDGEVIETATSAMEKDWNVGGSEK